jgi:hypothetical protein
MPINLKNQGEIFSVANNLSLRGYKYFNIKRGLPGAAGIIISILCNDIGYFMLRSMHLKTEPGMQISD